MQLLQEIAENPGLSILVQYGYGFSIMSSFCHKCQR